MGIGLYSIAESNRWPYESVLYGRYVNEILAHTGLPFINIDPLHLTQQLESLSIVILPAHILLSEDEATALKSFVSAGGYLIGLGGTSGLDEVFGCRDLGRVPEAWVELTAPAHPVMRSLTGPLHAFGGRKVEVVSASAQILAQWLDGNLWHENTGWDNARCGPAVVTNRYNKGQTLLIAPDLAHTVVRIQQGRAVHSDGTPAADGTVPLNDKLLKVDDGLVLDYDRDRVIIEGCPTFACPVTDEWREMLLRAILWGAQSLGQSLPMLWFWPRNLPAVGQISHDTDNNIPATAESMFRYMQGLDIPSTWCVQYPGGYSPDFYTRLQTYGSEIALHFDCYSDKGNFTWSEGSLCLQLTWLQDMAKAKVVSNKNHYLRWEGLTEFFVWLEKYGVMSDQSKGPTKKGIGGFPFGGSHPWFPMEEHRLRMINVLEINHHTWELASRWPLEVGKTVVRQARARGGSPHFLFHPGAVVPGRPVADALSSIVNYGKELGMEWWTNAQIQTWERARRSVHFTQIDPDTWELTSDVPLQQATVLMFAPPGAVNPQRSASETMPGCPAQMQVVDIMPGERLVWRAQNQAWQIAR